MARSRNIKPAFFMNEQLGELSAEIRLLFIALWGQADRDGRLEDRPKRIKVLALPYDEINIDEALAELHKTGFIERYQVDGERFIQVVNFSKHQNPHHREVGSTIPAPGKPEASPGQAPDKPENSPSRALLIPDSFIPDSLINTSPGDDRFDEWWALYPRKVEKKKALQIWKRRKLDKLADTIIEDTRTRPTRCESWQKGFIPNPPSYLNGDRWQDESQPSQLLNGVERPPAPALPWYRTITGIQEEAGNRLIMIIDYPDPADLTQALILDMESKEQAVPEELRDYLQQMLGADSGPKP